MSSELKMSDQGYLNEIIKSFIRNNKDLERKTDQHLENIEATQRIIIEKEGGTKSLLELNYKEILKNRNEILENRKVIEVNKDEILENRRLIEVSSEKLDKIIEKLGQ